MEAAALQRRTLRVLVGVQMLGGAGFFLGFAVSILLAKRLTDADSLVGIPVAIAVASAALAARPLGSWMQRSGRRPGLAAGQLAGGIGAVVVVASDAAGSFALLCVGMALFGSGNASNLLARYAASDLAVPEARAKAISAVLLATAVGAILGPNLAEAAGALGDPLSISDEAAPFAISALLLALCAVLTWILLRPDPLLAARAAGGGGEDGNVEAPGLREWPVQALVGAGAMVLANVAMVAVMTVTPLHLDDAGQSLGTVGLVISLHVAGMFLPSPISGALADRHGRLPVIAVGGLVLLLSGILAAPTSGHHTGPVIAALVLLGIGWNLALVGGSALLVDAVPIEWRAKAQGQADFMMGMAGAVGSLAAGAAHGLLGFASLGIGGAFLGAGIVVLALRAGLVAQLRPAE